MNTAVLIPAYNAAQSLSEVLERTQKIIPISSIIVIDDGSTDATKQIAEKSGAVILPHEKNLGKGAALQTGFDHALKNGFDSVITMDSDLQHQPEDIPRFLTHHEVTGCDVIMGSRLHNTKGMPFHRFLSNTITTGLVKARTGAEITDSQSGFRFIHRRVLENVQLTTAGFEAETEFLIKAAARKCSFGSIPIDTIYAGEKSSMTHLTTTVNFITVLLRQY
ncbi:MAG: glycosyltransferase family 2 protein [Bacteroidota bacterium]